MGGTQREQTCCEGYYDLYVRGLCVSARYLANKAADGMDTRGAWELLWYFRARIGWKAACARLADVRT